jgi:GTPase SAR1 family protein
MSGEPSECNICIFGDQRVGKTTFTTQFVTGQFVEGIEPATCVIDPQSVTF